MSSSQRGLRPDLGSIIDPKGKSSWCLHVLGSKKGTLSFHMAHPLSMITDLGARYRGFLATIHRIVRLFATLVVSRRRGSYDLLIVNQRAWTASLRLGLNGSLSLLHPLGIYLNISPPSNNIKLGEGTISLGRTNWWISMLSMLKYRFIWACSEPTNSGHNRALSVKILVIYVTILFICLRSKHSWANISLYTKGTYLVLNIS